MKKIKSYTLIVLAALISSCGNTNEEQKGAELETEVISKNNCSNEKLFESTFQAPSFLFPHLKKKSPTCLLPLN